MKRNMGVIRDILLAVESDRDPNEIPGHDAETLRYHQALVVEANLVNGTVDDTVSNTTNIPSMVFLRNLTWQGHEFIDSVREESIWNTIKSEFRDASLETVVKVSKQLAEGWAKKKVGGIAT